MSCQCRRTRRGAAGGDGFDEADLLSVDAVCVWGVVCGDNDFREDAAEAVAYGVMGAAFVGSCVTGG